MKKFIILSLALVIGAMSLNSCKKYEEGPGISLRSKKARLTGEWKLIKSVYNGVTEASTSDTEELLEFDKDGTVTISETYEGTTESFSGTWDWADSKESIVLTFSFFGFSSSETYPLVKLTNKEMVWEGTDVDGDTFRQEFEKQ